MAEQIAGQARTWPAASGAVAEVRRDPLGPTALIWVEDDVRFTTDRSRSRLVVAHGNNQSVLNRSCVNSYPAGHAIEHGAAASNRLADHDLPPLVQCLWPVAPTVVPPDGRAAPTLAPAGQEATATPPAYPAAPGTRDQLEAWVNEGGAGENVAT